MGLRDRYIQGMVLSGVGDAIGYKNGEWEFCHSGLTIYTEVQKLGGLDKLKVKLPKFMVSDDTVMHLATGETLVDKHCQTDRGMLFLKMADAYKKCMHDMTGRAPGNTCMMGTHQLKPLRAKGYQIPFNPRGGGCGAAMRAMCIGLRYPRADQLNDLIAVSVESGRMSHHHPTGYLGSLAAALFTSYCVQGVGPVQWGKGLMDTLPLALKYVESTGHCVKENKETWAYFTEQWTKYLKLRGLETGESGPIFPEKYEFGERDKFYKSVSFSGWGGSSGHDAPMIAYDAYLGANGNWLELCKRGLFHGGDSDSTGVMAACWYGVVYGWDAVSPSNYQKLEYRDRLEKIGGMLYDLAFPNGESEPHANVELKEGAAQCTAPNVESAHGGDKNSGEIPSVEGKDGVEKNYVVKDDSVAQSDDNETIDNKATKMLDGGDLKDEVVQHQDKDVKGEDFSENNDVNINDNIAVERDTKTDLSTEGDKDVSNEVVKENDETVNPETTYQKAEETEPVKVDQVVLIEKEEAS